MNLSIMCSRISCHVSCLWFVDSFVLFVLVATDAGRTQRRRSSEGEKHEGI